MKRKFKRIASLVLAAVMVFAMAVPAMAASADTYSITVTDVPKEGHTFKAYQIFIGTVIKDQDVLGDPVWGDGLSTAGQSALATALEVADPTDVAAVIDALNAKKVEGGEDAVQAIIRDVVSVAENLVPANAKGPATFSKVGDNYNYTIDDLTSGYYVVLDEPNGTLGQEDVTYSGIIVQVASGNVTVKTKTSVPTSNKEVLDVNDSEGGEDTWGDSADHDINNHVSFRLTGTVAQNYADYKTYYFEFHDTLSKGLTYDDESYRVYVNDIKVTVSGDIFSKETNSETGETTLSFKFENLKTAIPSVKAGNTIKIEYTATLNENALIGNDGNMNKMYLEYSNNPQGNDHGKTPEKQVFVFTFDVNIDKVDQDEAALEGAEFTLEKYVNGDWENIGKLTGTAGSQFNFKGIDDGLYRLTETKTPNGYNTLDPKEVYIKVTAEHSAEDKIKSLTAEIGSWTERSGFEKDTAGTKEGKVVQLTPNMEGKEIPTLGTVGSYGVLEGKIRNNKGATLPETGGIGTTIFYVVGSVLVLGAVILLVTKRRMKSE